MDGLKRSVRPEIEPVRTDISRPAASLEGAPSTQPRQPLEVFKDSGPKHAALPSMPQAPTAAENPGFWSRVKSFFGGSGVPKPALRQAAPQAKPEPLEEGWENIAPETTKPASGEAQRSYKLPAGVNMDDVDKQLELLSDEMYADEASENDRSLAELEALPSPPKTKPQVPTASVDDLTARLNRLREGYTPPSPEAQLSARLRDLTNSNIPSLENALAGVSGPRVNPQDAAPEQIRAQSAQFLQSVTGMAKELQGYLKSGVSLKSKSDAGKYASRISDRVNTESKLVGNSIIQIGQRTDLSSPQKQNLISGLRDQQAALKKVKDQVQQFRFSMTKQLSEAASRGRK